MNKLMILCLLLVGHKAIATSILDAVTTPTQTAAIPIEDSCIDYAHGGDCQFFRCFEDRHPCPSRNYAIDYGWRFCSRFDLEKSRMTVDGQRWLNDTRQCIMEQLLAFYLEDSVVCSDLAATMKDQRGSCEVESGLCSAGILVDNKEVFTDVYSFNRQSATQFVHSVKHCTISTARQVANWFRDNVGRISVTSVIREVRNQIRELGADILGEIRRIRDTLTDSEGPRNNIETVHDNDTE